MDPLTLALLREWLINNEGWINWPYLDIANPPNPTIGVGFNMSAGAPRAAAGQPIANQSPSAANIMSQQAGITNYVTLFNWAQPNTPTHDPASPQITNAQTGALLDYSINQAISYCEANLPNWSITDPSNPLYISDARRVAILDIYFNVGHLFPGFMQDVRNGNWQAAANNLIYTNGVGGNYTPYYANGHGGTTTPRRSRVNADIYAITNNQLDPGHLILSRTQRNNYNSVYGPVPASGSGSGSGGGGGNNANFPPPWVNTDNWGMIGQFESTNWDYNLQNSNNSTNNDQNTTSSNVVSPWDWTPFDTPNYPAPDPNNNPNSNPNNKPDNSPNNNPNNNPNTTPDNYDPNADPNNWIDMGNVTQVDGNGFFSTLWWNSYTDTYMYSLRNPGDIQIIDVTPQSNPNPNTNTDTDTNDTDFNNNDSLPSDDTTPTDSNTINVTNSNPVDVWNWSPLSSNTDSTGDNNSSSSTNGNSNTGTTSGSDSSGSDTESGSDSNSGDDGSGNNSSSSSSSGSNNSSNSGDDTGDSSGSDDTGNCFIKGTLISTSQGLIPIEQVKQGQSIYSYDFELKKVVLEAVEKIINSESDKIMVLDFGEEIIQCTPRHRFYTGQWVTAEDLKTGNAIMDRNGNWIQLRGKLMETKLQEVINFQISKTHNYFVGHTTLLVHNDKKPSDADDPGDDNDDPDYP